MDYGMGNLGSVQNMFKYIKVPAKISSDKKEIAKASKLLLPGVGSFASAMNKINSSGFKDILNHKVLVEKTPVLGICLGMQLLTSFSEEGNVKGLDWIKATTRRFRFEGKGIKIPHMGWNKVHVVRETSLIKGFDDAFSFYFVHSYYVKCKDREDAMLETQYGLTFASGIHRDNIYGVQFHPEKSHKFGMKMLQNFADL